MNEKRTLNFKKIFADILIYLELIIMVIIVLYPVLWVIGSSFNPINGVSNGKIIPDNATLNNYIRLFTQTKYPKWYLNTFYVACMTTVFSVLINSITAYVFARIKFRGRKVALMSIIVLQMFPSFLGLTAIYLLCYNFGLLDNINTLIIIYVAGGIPGNIWLIRGYLLNIPKSLDEAACIDGASKWQVFSKIILPLSTPIIAFMALSSFMSPWVDYMLPRYLISSTDKRTVAVGLFEFVKNGAGTKYDFTAFASGAVLIGVPITITYMVFQKYLIYGMTAGANKGE